MPRHNFIVEVYREILGLHGLVFVLTCSLKSGALYAQVCAFLNYVQSNQCAIDGLHTPTKFHTHLKDN